MIKKLDYNAIKWEDYFYLDETSPSGLRWKVERRCGEYYSRVNVVSGSVAGTLHSKYGKDPRQWWCVSLEKKLYKVHRIIYILLKGVFDNTLVIDHLDGNSTNNAPSNLALKSPKANSQNAKMRTDNTSGIKGVNLFSTLRKGIPYNYWVAQWQNTDSKSCSKTFSVNKFGADRALKLAIDYRINQIKLLNELGEDYTERHYTINNAALSFEQPLDLTPRTPEEQIKAKALVESLKETGVEHKRLTGSVTDAKLKEFFE